MQLSLPISTFPAPPAPKQAAGKNSATSGSPGDPTETAAAESFDSLLPKNGNLRDADKPASSNAKKSDAETEQTAAILTAGFWMPLPPAVMPPPAPAPATTAPATPASPSASPSDPIDAKAVPDPAIGTPASVVAENATGAAQVAAIPLVAPGPFSVTPPQSLKKAAGNPAAISTDKTAKNGTPSTSAIATDETVAADAALPAVAPVANAGPKTATSDLASNAVAVPEADSAANGGIDTDVAAKAVPTIAAGILPSPAPAQLGQEKIAPLAPLPAQAQKFLSSVAEKYFLNPLQKAVTTTTSAVGTAVAKVNATMAATAPARSKSDSTGESTTAFVYSADRAPTATLTLDAPAPVATVRETMAAVISAVDALERRADVQQKSVDLQFNVGSEKLGLRVELRDGMVHTTFQTESSEMNNALSHEWRAVVQPALSRDIHLADPVFHSSPTPGNAVPAASSDSASTAFGQGAQHQREQQKAPPTFASALKREFYDSAAPASSPAVAAVSSSSQLLNALA